MLNSFDVELQLIQGGEKTLDCRFIKIDKEGAKAIAKVLTTNKTLIHLDLGWNNIGDEGVKAILEALKANTTLTQLDLNLEDIGDEGAKAILEVLEANTTLTQLVLSWNKISDAGTEAIATALKINKTLTHLTLLIDTNHGGVTEAIATAVATNKTLISFTSNNSGGAGGKVILKALKTNTTLTKLDLCWSMMGVDGPKYLETALEINVTLTQLGFLGNRIGDDGAKAIANALATNKTLAYLDLSWNNIGDDGATAILKALKTNTTLTELLLNENNSINDILQGRIQQLINRNKAWLLVKNALTALAEVIDTKSLVESLGKVFDMKTDFITKHPNEQYQDLRFPFVCTLSQVKFLPHFVSNSIRSIQSLPIPKTENVMTTLTCFIDITKVDVTCFGDLIPTNLLPALTPADLSALNILAKKHSLQKIQAEIDAHMMNVTELRSVSGSSMVNFSFNTLASSSTPATGSSSASPPTKKTKWAQPI